MKDQGDVKEMPTTMGSILFKDHMPGRDAFVVAQLRAAGAIPLAKATLGELGAGDTHGSLFGSTKNVYDFERTAGRMADPDIRQSLLEVGINGPADLLATFIFFFAVIDPIGAVPVFIAVTNGYESTAKTKIGFRSSTGIMTTSTSSPIGGPEQEVVCRA